MAPVIRGQSGLWFVDDVAALMAVIRGRSTPPELDGVAGCVHTVLRAMSSVCYFEWTAPATGQIVLVVKVPKSSGFSRTTSNALSLDRSFFFSTNSIGCGKSLQFSSSALSALENRFP